MNKVNRHFYIFTGFVLFLLLICNISAALQESEISFTGQVTWQDIEGGFYGIITPDGTKYLPLSLPESYQVDGVTVDITGTIPSDVMTMQMWGEPIEIQSINPVNEKNPFSKSWYAPANNTPYYEYDIQAEYLIMAAAGLQTGLDSIDEKVSSIAQNLTQNRIEEENITRMLLQVFDIPGVVGVSLLDESGRITAAVPEKYAHIIGEDVSGQDFSSSRLLYPVPGMSKYFTTIQEIDAVILSYPVFSADKKIAGYITALIDPANVTETYALPCLNGTKFDLMVAQPDGKILYDGHPDMNGQEMWNNPIFNEFPDLFLWAAHFQNTKAGIDQCTYFRGNSEEIAQTDVIWTTVALHGTPWRIFILSR